MSLVVLGNYALCHAHNYKGRQAFGCTCMNVVVDHLNKKILVSLYGSEHNVSRLVTSPRYKVGVNALVFACLHCSGTSRITFRIASEGADFCSAERFTVVWRNQQPNPV